MIFFFRFFDNAMHRFTMRTFARLNLLLEEISRLLSNSKLAQLAKNMDEINPEKTFTKSGTEDIFEI